MCGDDPDPDINKDDVSKDKGKALPGGIAPSDGQEALDGHVGGKEARFLEQFETRTFESVWPDVEGIKSNVPSPDVDAAWRSIGEQLHTSVLNFETALRTLSDSGGWEGQTIQAAYTNAMESTSEPFFTGTAALRGAELTHKFRDILNYVHENLVKDPLGAYPDMWQRYQFDLNNSETPIEGAPGQQETYYEPTTEAEKAAIREYYNEYMRIVMRDSYIPGIRDIYGGYPSFIASNEAARPIEIPGLPQGPGKPTHKPGDNTSTGDGNGQPSIGGGGLPTSNLGGGKPSISKLSGPSLPDGLKSLQDELKHTKLPSDTDIPGRPGQNDQRPSLTDPSQTPGGLPSGLANAANQALGSATQAASQAAKALPNGLPKDLPKKPNVPEGALRLGKEGAGGARGGGGGASLGGVPKGPLSGLSGLPAAATHAAAAGTSQPGMGANAPAMGPPGSPGAAGHGAGGAQQGKEHKANKALRSRRRGIEIAGEAEAVVPVVGQDQDQEQQKDEAPTRRRPDPSRMPPTPPPATPVSTAEQERRQLRGRG